MQTTATQLPVLDVTPLSEALPTGVTAQDLLPFTPPYERRNLYVVDGEVVNRVYPGSPFGFWGRKHGRLAEMVERTRHRRGEQAVKSLWDDLCEDAAARARTLRTARDLLAVPAARKGMYRLLDDGRKYSADLDYYATRRVIAEARQILADRRQRRADRAIAVSDPKTGRIAKLATPIARANRLGESDHKKLWIRRQLLDPEVRRLATPDTLTVALRKVSLGDKQRETVLSDLAKRHPSESVARIVAESIGEIGEQAERDLSEFGESEQLDGKRGRHHWYERSVVDRIQLGRDPAGRSQALVTVADIKSWGAAGYGGADGYGKQSGVSHRVYLIVRDASRGTAHILRVAPKYGNPDRKFFHRFDSVDERVEAARESTFAGLPLAGAIEA